MNLVKLQPRSPKGMLEVLDEMRRQIEDGEIVAFAAVSIGPDDSTHQHSGAVEGVSNLRMVGALAVLQHCYIDGMD